MVFHNPFSNKNIQIFHQLFSKLTRSILIQTNPVHRIAFRMSSDLRRKNHSDLHWHQQTILYLSFHQWNINRHGYNNFYQINFIKLWYPPPEKKTHGDALQCYFGLLEGWIPTPTSRSNHYSEKIIPSFLVAYFCTLMVHLTDFFLTSNWSSVVLYVHLSNQSGPISYRTSSVRC